MFGAEDEYQERIEYLEKEIKRLTSTSIENRDRTAFPMGELINHGEHPVNCKGFDKREYISTHILAGMMQSCRHEEEHLHYAIQAVAYADALLEALSKP